MKKTIQAKTSEKLIKLPSEVKLGSKVKDAFLSKMNAVRERESSKIIKVQATPV